MIIFVDTSAFFALLDRDDANHQKAKKTWSDLLNPENTFITSNYVIVESFALIQHRLGLEAVRGFYEDLLPLINVEWVDESMHKSGVSALLAASRRKLSFVDCVSFETMRRLGIKTVFAFDPHFEEQGYECIP
ncbi:MAG: PIN domain-containing protein [Desulfobacterales bacterium]|nr:PIN domain-containing protein [Desulfobacterales bacterium]